MGTRSKAGSDTYVHQVLNCHYTPTLPSVVIAIVLTKQRPSAQHDQLAALPLALSSPPLRSSPCAALPPPPPPVAPAVRLWRRSCAARSRACPYPRACFQQRRRNQSLQQRRRNKEIVGGRGTGVGAARGGCGSRGARGEGGGGRAAGDGRGALGGMLQHHVCTRDGVGGTGLMHEIRGLNRQRSSYCSSWLIRRAHVSPLSGQHQPGAVHGHGQLQPLWTIKIQPWPWDCTAPGLVCTYNTRACANLLSKSAVQRRYHRDVSLRQCIGNWFERSDQPGWLLAGRQPAKAAWHAAALH